MTRNWTKPGTGKRTVMWRSHQPRFQPDLNRGLYRERVGVQFLSCLDVNLDNLAAKKISPINTIASTIGTVASDRMTS